MVLAILTEYVRSALMPEFDLREYPDIVETINLIIRNGGIAEIKVERRTTPTVVEIKRVKRFPPKD